MWRKHVFSSWTNKILMNSHTTVKNQILKVSTWRIKIKTKRVSTNDDRLPNWPGLLVPIKRHESHLIQTQDNPRTQIMWRWQAQFSNLAELQIAKTVTMRTSREAIFWSRFCLIVFFWLIQLEIWKWSSICRFFKFLKNLLKCFWMYSKVHQLVFNLSLWWISC